MRTAQFAARVRMYSAVFPAAIECGRRGGTLPCIFNAANSVAVAAFIKGRLNFLGIADLIARTLTTH